MLVLTGAAVAGGAAAAAVSAAAPEAAWVVEGEAGHHPGRSGTLARGAD
ncbi:hypothetical protein N752_05420 [Desulforamulus aquiferis]|nr:hypothetical protein N752_05420 [Desulforamulus aquiferis]